jgi:hypothetical protein
MIRSDDSLKLKFFEEGKMSNQLPIPSSNNLVYDTKIRTFISSPYVVSFPPSTIMNYEDKPRSFHISSLTLNKPLKLVIPKIRRTFEVNEMQMDNDLDKIYMEIAQYSRLYDYNQYIYDVKNAQYTINEGKYIIGSTFDKVATLNHPTGESVYTNITLDQVVTDVEAHPLHDLDCRRLNLAEYEIFRTKLNNKKH